VFVCVFDFKRFDKKIKSIKNNMLVVGLCFMMFVCKKNKFLKVFFLLCTRQIVDKVQRFSTRNNNNKEKLFLLTHFYNDFNFYSQDGKAAMKDHEKLIIN
jgi:hypothetical protein